MHLNRYEEARDVLEAHLLTAPGTADTYLVLGKVYEQLKDLAKAQRCLETAVALAPQRPDALYSLGTVSAKLGEHDKAAKYREWFDRVKRRQLQAEAKMGTRAEIQDHLFIPLRVAEILRLAVRACLDRDDAPRAEKWLLRATEASPDDAESRRALLAVYEKQGRLEDAIRLAVELRRIEPDNIEHDRAEALLYARAGRFEDAQRAFQELCRRAPESGFGYTGLAELYLRAGRNLAEARALAEKAVQREPTARGCAVLAALAERMGDPASARAALEQAMAIEPQNPKYRQMYDAVKQR
jgi:tetratricopeptide (TPR) repeat protein